MTAYALKRVRSSTKQNGKGVLYTSPQGTGILNVLVESNQDIHLSTILS